VKKIFFSLVILVSLVFLWYKAVDFSEIKTDETGADEQDNKAAILRFALVADSESENDQLKKALDIAKSRGVSFVIGLGDFTSLGEESDLLAVKKVFDDSGLKYYVTAGDRDMWDSRDNGWEATVLFEQAFGKPTHEFGADKVGFLVLSNADIYKGITGDDWEQFNSFVAKDYKLKFIFAHKTPYHPQSAHIMGEDSVAVADQAKRLIKLVEENKVDGFFSGDLHFFARFNSPNGVKITTIGAVSAARNFQGPRFAIVTVYNDYSWEVEDVEIR
jgi:predicted phosphodiesterase